MEYINHPSKKRQLYIFTPFAADEPLVFISLSVLFFSLLDRARKQPLYSSSTLSLAGWVVGSTIYKQLPDITREKVTHTRCTTTHPERSVSACVTG